MGMIRGGGGSRSAKTDSSEGERSGMVPKTKQYTRNIMVHSEAYMYRI